MLQPASAPAAGSRLSAPTPERPSSHQGRATGPPGTMRPMPCLVSVVGWSCSSPGVVAGLDAPGCCGQRRGSNAGS
ncbi:hypothetical protein Zm00014a_007110 [Zea mays]|uniref:Uncharacterized protein n=1 Tax=Zea mays TaxID=4577 RepID=A0A3L6EVI6_MAIZE|nr:hypothetical protein Zm00014a_007110 [Zea mays]